MEEVKEGFIEKEGRFSNWEELLEKYEFNQKDIFEGNILKGKIIKISKDEAVVNVGFKADGIIPIEELFNWKKEIGYKEGDKILVTIERSDLRDGYLTLSKKKADFLIGWKLLEKAHNRKFPVRGRIEQKVKNGYIVNVGIPVFLPDSQIEIRPKKNDEDLIGKILDFKVIKLDKKNNKVVVSRKVLVEEEKEERKNFIFNTLKEGKLVKGKITSIKNWGIFIDLGGVEGLLHINDISWGRISHPSEVFSRGEEVEVVVLKINRNEGKIALGYKQKTPNPWDVVDRNYRVGQKIKGKVVGVTEFGVFVEIEKGMEGLIHLSDLSWDKRIKNPKKILSPNDTIEVVILDIKKEEKKISLGLKQVGESPWEKFCNSHTVGQIVKGRIKNLTDFGAFLEIENGVEGLIHISDISWSKISHPSEVLKPGDKVEAVILKLNKEEKKLSLGIKQLKEGLWHEFFKNYKIGDLVNVKILRTTNFGVFVELMPGIDGLVHVSEIDGANREEALKNLKIGEIKKAMIIKMSPQEKKIGLSFKAAVRNEEKHELESSMSKKKSTLGSFMNTQIKSLSNQGKNR
ncbi:MAG: 30S ribosomal protein S1 [Acidobacteriota bacterium]